MKQWIDREQQTILRDFPIELPTPIPPTIHGWMWEWELRWLYGLAQRLQLAGVEGDLLEVGSYKGLSASALGQAGRLVCVDTFSGGEDLPETSTLETFREAMRTMKLEPEVLVGRSQDVLPKLVASGRKFRLILLDGSHAYESVATDLLNAWQLVSPGGAVVCDDYIGFEGVVKAVNECGHAFYLCSPQFSKMAVGFKER